MKNLVLVSVLILSFVSCQKDIEDELLNPEQSGELKPKESSVYSKINLNLSIADYIAFANGKASEYALFQANSTAFSLKPHRHGVLSVVLGNNVPYGYLINGNSIVFNDLYHNTADNTTNAFINPEEITNFYGERLLFSFSDNTIIANSSESEESVYVPKKIKFVDDGTLEQVSMGSTLYWNTDHNNDRGVVFGIQYEPLDQVDSVMAQNFPSFIYRGGSLPDNGSVTLTPDFFEGIPNGAFVSIFIGRAGFTNLSLKGTEDYSFAAVTLSDFSTKYAAAN